MVFVHGLGGDVFATWRHGRDESTSWPHWLGQDFPEIGVWSLGYAASPTKWARVLGWVSQRWRDSGHGMALPDRALQVLDAMVQQGLGRRPLLFIGHSLGGLLVKQILRTASDAGPATLKGAVFANTRAVLFLATPHAGAGLASLADSFRLVFGPTVTLQGLKAHDAHLIELLNWYRNHAPPAGIETATYYERRALRGVTIVDPTSSQAGVGADPVPLDEDHLSIAKPRERDAQVCEAARALLRSHVLEPRTAPAIPPALQLVVPVQLPPIVVQLHPEMLGRPAAPLVPQELPPAAERFFGREDELARLTQRLRAGKSTAVVGPAGMGKTALAAAALEEVVGTSRASLAASPYSHGVVYLDLYLFHGQAEPAWNALANKLAGAGFMERSPARERATEACRGRHLLVVIEGGEEADGKDGRATFFELRGVLSLENRWLLLSRLSTQADTAQTVELREALAPEDAGHLLDSLTLGRVSGAVRERVLALVEGHPLALTWAGNLLARGDDAPERLLEDWAAEQLPRLSDPKQAERTLDWLFERSVRGLDDTARKVLAAAGLLAHAPFPLAAIQAAVAAPDQGESQLLEALKSLVQRSILRLAEERDHWQFTHVLGYRFARQESGSDRDVRLGLARWAHGTVMAALQAEGSGGARRSLAGALEHVAALLRADDDQSLWKPLARPSLYEIADRLEELGLLVLVKLSLGAVVGWLARFPADKALEPFWLRERTVLLNDQGDVLVAQGDLGGALTAYRESLAVRRRLAEADASNAGWQRDVSVSLNRVAENLARLDRSAEGLPLAEESLAIAERLAALDRSHVTWQKDLAFTRALVARLLGN